MPRLGLTDFIFLVIVILDLWRFSAVRPDIPLDVLSTDVDVASPSVTGLAVLARLVWSRH